MSLGVCRSCGDSIQWIRTAAGKAMSLNLAKVKNGNIEVEDGVAVYVKPDPEVERSVSHFATCKFARSPDHASTQAPEEVMKLSADITVYGEVTVNDREAELLVHLTSFNLATAFAEKFSQKYTAKELTETLSDLNAACAQIVRAKRNAELAVDR